MNRTNEPESVSPLMDKAVSFTVGMAIVIFLTEIIMLMLAPLFIDSKREELCKKYEKFTHKQALVDEECNKYIKRCIIAWVIMITLLVLGNLNHLG